MVIGGGVEGGGGGECWVDLLPRLAFVHPGSNGFEVQRHVLDSTQGVENMNKALGIKVGFWKFQHLWTVPVCLSPPLPLL